MVEVGKSEYSENDYIMQITIDVVADDVEGATEYIYSNFGSKHRVPRRFVIISSISEIDPAESTEPRVISAFRE